VDESCHTHDSECVACVAVCCSVLQCVAVCCRVLQSVSVCCSVLQCVAVCCSMRRVVSMCRMRCSVLQCAAVCFSVLQRVSLCCSMRRVVGMRRMRCIVLQCVAVCCTCCPCNILQHPTTHCSVMRIKEANLCALSLASVSLIFARARAFFETHPKHSAAVLVVHTHRRTDNRHIDTQTHGDSLPNTLLSHLCSSAVILIWGGYD